MIQNLSHTAIFLLAILLIKHFFADWFFQSDRMAKLKGSEMRWLALHVLIHCIATFVVLFLFLPLPTLLVLLGIEFIVHGLIDWSKANPFVAKKFPFPTHSFWVLIGVDQLAHQMFYMSVVSWMISSR